MSSIDGGACRRIVGAALTALVVALVAGHAPLAGQEEGRDCHCVDAEGERIENCTCFRIATPDLSGMTWSFGLAKEMPRVRIGIGIETTGADAEVEGVLIRSVEEGSPAEEAGLEAGDVVTHLDGRSLLDPLPSAEVEERAGEERADPLRRFMALVRELDPGEEVEIRYSRGGESRSAVVVPEERGLLSMLARHGRDRSGSGRLDPDGLDGGKTLRFRFRDGDSTFRHLPTPLHFFRFENRAEEDEGPDARRGVFRLHSDGPGLVSFLGRGGSPCFDAAQRRDLFVVIGGGCVDGLWLEELNPQLAEYFDVSEGVLVTRVSEEAGFDLAAGDVIVAVGGREVTDPSDVRRILGSYETDEEVELTVVRKGERMEIRGRRR